VVQAEDLRCALRALLRRSGAPTQRILAARSGVAERTVSRILHGRDLTTRYDIADALLIALDEGDLVETLRHCIEEHQHG
jgi:transcriptional regulator with XRE-family HTH domain